MVVMNKKQGFGSTTRQSKLKTESFNPKENHLELKDT